MTKGLTLPCPCLLCDTGASATRPPPAGQPADGQGAGLSRPLRSCPGPRPHYQPQHTHILITRRLDDAPHDSRKKGLQRVPGGTARHHFQTSAALLGENPDFKVCSKNVDQERPGLFTLYLHESHDFTI